ncbi:type I-U CRISPR-associated helicase/endonuclease Cas3 [Oceanimonas smirnovii]|uniref:type I-G CRISPR-associated helicase/endonuclease Cas3g n=1 Tax=Oceanimonas smirnovii TaxID=264574 RepID=UPI003AAE9AC5
MNFPEFFKHITGFSPYPWQVEAADRLCRQRPLTDVTLPTAAGKTALLIAAVYAAAHGGRRRICFIIDRRLVVDEAFLMAEQIQRALIHNPALLEIRRRLGDIQLVKLRGGQVNDDDDWLLYPEKVSIMVATIDQIGSRLLHRGYNVSPRKWSMHSGFVGHDALWLLDEAHLSQPFVETVQTCIKAGAGIQLIKLTATPNLMNAQGILGLGQADRENPHLKNKLQVSKPASLCLCSDQAEFLKKVQVNALEFVERLPRGEVIGVVVNTIKMARRLHQQLTTRLSKNKKIDAEAILLIGRNRPWEQKELLARYWHRIAVGRERATDNPTLIVIATQTIEVGANLDFDVMLTELAPLSSLRQRLGRLGREGIQASYPAVIYALAKQSEKADPKAPVYGETLYSAWQWLCSRAECSDDNIVDFGISGIEKCVALEPMPEEPPEPQAYLLPTHLNMLYQTGFSAPRVDVAQFLHGPVKQVRDVSILWRRMPGTPINEDLCLDEIKAVPPLKEEAIQLPLLELKKHLLKKQQPEVSDLLGEPELPDERSDKKVQVVRWCGQSHDDTKFITLDEIRPGDTLILSAEQGGIDRFGWHFGSEERYEMTDIAEQVYCYRHEQANTGTTDRYLKRLRLADVHLEAQFEPAYVEEIKKYRNSLLEILNAVTEVGETDRDEEIATAETALFTCFGSSGIPWLADIKYEHYRLEYLYDKQQDWVHGMIVVPRLENVELAGTVSLGVSVELDHHNKGVGKMAASLSIGHPEENSIIQAASRHDEGKRYSNMQSVLHGRQYHPGLPALAKSESRNVAQRRLLIQHFAFPRNFRHELHSLDYLTEAGDLVHYLTATHHGYGRPWFPVCEEPDAPGQAHGLLSAEWPAKFQRQLEQYGAWPLANMELIVRAADIRQSIHEQQNKGQQDD